MLQLVVWLVMGLAGAVLHPFHISICEIEHNEDEKSLQITSRIFQDDFELALKQSGKADEFFKNTSEQEAEKVLQDFFNEHLQLSLESEPLEHKLLGFEIEENVVWSYLEIENVNAMEQVSVQYSVLIDTFNDQINLAHIRYRDQVKSLKFQLGQLSGTTAFAN